MKKVYIFIILIIFISLAATYILVKTGVHTITPPSLASSDVLGGKSQGSQRLITDNTISVSIQNLNFMPQEIIIRKGTKVIWINGDNISHQIISDDEELFKSDALSTGNTFSFTFDKTGEFSYHCKIHPSMTGKIDVVE